MKSVLNKWLTDVAYDKFKQGKGTSASSKLLSFLFLHLLVLSAAILFNDHRYITLIIFLIFGFTPVGVWIAIGIIIYFVFISYWVGVIVLALYVSVGFFSSWYGLRGIKRNILTGKTGINPFEGMPDLIIYSIVQLVFFGAALISKGIISLISWILYGIVALLFMSRLYFRIGTKWRQIHFPLMVRYSMYIGKEVLDSKNEGREERIENALINLLISALPGIDNSVATEIVDNAILKLGNFTDREGMREFLRKKYPNATEEKIEKVLGAMTNDATSKHNWLKVRYVIAEVIEHDHGESERTRYLFQVFSGNAK